MEKLKVYFLQSHFTAEEAERIVSLFHYKQFEKGDYFVREGKTSRQLGFVEEGLFQYYSLADGEERTTYISIQNSFVASLLSYLNEVPARENIRALTKATLLVINKKEVQQLLQEMPAFKDFYIKLIEWQICCIEKSRLDLITLTAEERYKKLLTEEPELLQQIPLQYLASMLGVTPRHLSRIRNIM